MMGAKATSNGKGLLFGNTLFPMMSQISSFFPKDFGFPIFSLHYYESIEDQLQGLTHLEVLSDLFSFRLKRYKEAFVTFEVLAFASAHNWVIQLTPWTDEKYF